MEANNLESKRIWSMTDFCTYTGFTRAYAYKLTCTRAISYFKPTGGKIFFESAEVIAWLTSNPVKSAEQIGMDASAYIMRHKRI